MTMHWTSVWSSKVQQSEAVRCGAAVQWLAMRCGLAGLKRTGTTGGDRRSGPAMVKLGPSHCKPP